MDWKGTWSDFLFGTNESFWKFETRFFLYNSSNKQEQFLEFRQKVIAEFA